jgi:DNA-binding NarL/FixJ family response regulator
LRCINAGRRYLSPSIAEALFRWRMSPSSIGRLLTDKEQLIFSIIGDGRDDQAAAQTLHLRPSTIQSMRRNIHRKLGISHKGELVRLAVQHGFVQFTADGVLQPGFAFPLNTAPAPPLHVSS